MISKKRRFLSSHFFKIMAGIVASSPQAIHAQVFTWNQTAPSATYNWPNAANWGGLGFPNANGDTANIDINIVGSQTIRLQQNIAIGTLNYGDSNGDNPLLLSSGTGTNTLTFQSVAAGGNTFFNMLGTGTVSNTISADIALGGTSALQWVAGTQVLNQDGLFTTNGNHINLTGGALNTASWNVNGNLSGGGTITYDGLGGIVINNTAKSFTGSFILNRGIGGVSNAGSLTVTTGSIANAAEVTINGYLSAGVVQNGGSLHSGNSSAANNNPGQRLTQNTIRLNGGSLNAAGQTATVGVANPWQQGLELVQDNVNILDFNSGFSLLGSNSSPTTAGTRLNITTLERSIGASAYVRGATIGTTSRILVANAAAHLVGAGGADGTTTMSIIPWMGVNDTVSGTAMPIGFGTHSANGIRALEVTSEYAPSISSGSTANVSTASVAIAGPTTVNSLRLTSFAAPVNIGAGQTLSITSGGIFFANGGSTLGQSGSAAAGNIAFGSAEGVVWSNASNTNTIGAALSGSQGLTKAGTGTLILTGANTYSGETHVGSGTLQIGDGTNPSNLGISNEVTVASGALLSLLNGSAINDTATLTLENIGMFNGMLSLSSGVNETVGGLFLGTTPMSSGTYGSTASLASFKNDTFFSGTGILNVIPEPTSGLIMLAGACSLALRRKRATSAGK